MFHKSCLSPFFQVWLPRSEFRLQQSVYQSLGQNYESMNLPDAPDPEQKPEPCTSLRIQVCFVESLNGFKCKCLKCILVMSSDPLLSCAFYVSFSIVLWNMTLTIVFSVTFLGTVIFIFCLNGETTLVFVHVKITAFLLVLKLQHATPDSPEFSFLLCSLR